MLVQKLIIAKELLILKWHLKDSLSQIVLMGLKTTWYLMNSSNWLEQKLYNFAMIWWPKNLQPNSVIYFDSMCSSSLCCFLFLSKDAFSNKFPSSRLNMRWMRTTTQAGRRSTMIREMLKMRKGQNWACQFIS